MDRHGFANFLQVSERTLYNWERGRRCVPVAVIKLLRHLTWCELPGKSWAGWHFAAGKLWSPERYGFEGTDSSWWSLTMRRAAMFGVLYKEREALRQQLQRARYELADAEARALQAEGRAGLVELAFIGAISSEPGATSAEQAAGAARVERQRDGGRAAAREGGLTLVEGRDGLVTRPVCLTGETFDDSAPRPKAPRFVLDLAHPDSPRYVFETSGTSP